MTETTSDAEPRGRLSDRRLPDRRLPDRRLPATYLAFAHLCLFVAFLTVALDPRSVAGFHYHPRMLGVVHLVTLGWITGSVLGLLYLVLPKAFGAPLPRRRLDGWALALFVIGVLGLVGHFWADAPMGMDSTAATLLLPILYIGSRVWRSLTLAPVDRATKLPFHLAFGNLLLAGLLGFWIALDKRIEVLPGATLAAVYAHAHLAAIGWVLMTVVGAAFGLLRILRPSPTPPGVWPWVTVIGLEVGTLGLAAGLLTAGSWTRWFALLCLLSTVLFLCRVGWMLRRPQPTCRPTCRPTSQRTSQRTSRPGSRPLDFGLLHITAALLWLATSAVLGAAILLTPDAGWKLAGILAYGALGLVGALAQIVVGVGHRLLPLYPWFRGLEAPRGSGPASTADPPEPPPQSSRQLPWRSGQALVLGLWGFGVPALALGLALNRMLLLRASGVALAGAVVLGAIALGHVLVRAERRSR